MGLTISCFSVKPGLSLSPNPQLSVSLPLSSYFYQPLKQSHVTSSFTLHNHIQKCEDYRIREVFAYISPSPVTLKEKASSKFQLPCPHQLLLQPDSVLLKTLLLIMVSTARLKSGRRASWFDQKSAAYNGSQKGETCLSHYNRKGGRRNRTCPQQQGLGLQLATQSSI